MEYLVFKIGIYFFALNTNLISHIELIDNNKDYKRKIKLDYLDNNNLGEVNYKEVIVLKNEVYFFVENILSIENLEVKMLPKFILSNRYYDFIEKVSIKENIIYIINENTLNKYYSDIEEDKNEKLLRLF